MTTYTQRTPRVNASATLSGVAGSVALVFSATVLVMTVGKKHWNLLEHLRHASKAQNLALAATVFTLIGLMGVYLLSQLVVAKSRVYNCANAASFEARNMPGFVPQDRGSESLTRFAANLEEVPLTSHEDSLAKAVAIRQWVRRQQSQNPLIWLRRAQVNHEDPHRLLDELRSGIPGSCRRFSYILLGALLSAGLDARIVSFTSRLLRRGVQRHVAVEVWIEELAKWVLMDPTCDTLVLVNGRPASAFELHTAVLREEAGTIEFERNGSSLEPHPSRQTYLSHCRHLFVGLSNAVFDGYRVRLIGPKRISFLHYSGAKPYPVFLKWLLLGASGGGICFGLLFWCFTLTSLVLE